MKNLILRPRFFEQFIGQKKLIKTLKAMIEGSKNRKEPLDHILFYGPPGVGKTSLATIIANETERKIHFLQGSLLEKKSDILSVFSVLNEGDIVFIDEIHSINKNVEELIYGAMEDFKIDIIIGPEGDSKVMRMNLKKFTLLGATTQINLISKPLKDRFGLKAKFNIYELEEIKEILKQSAKTLNIKIDDDNLLVVAEHSRNTPRIANHLLKRIDDFAQFNKLTNINKNLIIETFKHLELFPLGLTREHIDYLNVLNDLFNEKFASINTICGILNADKNNLINDIEPLLIFHQFIIKNARGRKITTKGINYLLNIKFKK
ncbi:Holliday junction branch migration DNA helicase RuvB [Mycoplasmopsis gallinarum]|uniref:Holliday junction branch migration complex subunit RuvB n=1 Tax=Mycoplasmopsis gallinarum TaxID=29557 RepID=A0A168RLX4_9BACT|nr:Holliday junction branch migration DNA helicase RuvB [Mycoplasmopsis gallinarum]OAB49106.1 Holliday junction DNA helicase RuvB [Mycoplasmopsis gallinarum]